MQIQSAMSKAVRGAILACIPEHIVDAALDAAMRVARAEVLKELGVNNFEDGVGKIVHGFEAKYKIPLPDLEATVGKPRALWAMHELDTLFQHGLNLRNNVTTPATFRAEASKIMSRPVIAETKAPWAAPAAAAPPGDLTPDEPSDERVRETTGDVAAGSAP
jgi:hypothetical protein